MLPWWLTPVFQKVFSMSIANYVFLVWIHCFNCGQVFFSFVHVAFLRSGIWVDNIALSQCNGTSPGSFQSCLENARKFWQPAGDPKRNHYCLKCSMDLPANCPQLASEEILVPICETYRAMRVPFRDDKCQAFPKISCKMPSFFLPLCTDYAVRANALCLSYDSLPPSGRVLKRFLILGVP